MPPALSDDEVESDGPDDTPEDIPATAEPSKEEDVADEDDDDDDDDGDEYRVEKILEHGFAEDGSLIYRIKWLGYEKKSDQTWEPTENLTNAVELLDEYHNKIGGIPQPPEKKKKGGAKGGKRSAATAFPDSPAVRTSAKKGRKANTNGTSAREWSPPNGLWEEEVTRVSSIIEEADAEIQGGKGTSEKGLFGLLEWNNGMKTQFPLEIVRRKCPQRLLDYYEQHLVFRTGGGAEAEAEEE